MYVLKINKMVGMKRQPVWQNTFHFQMALAVGSLRLEVEPEEGSAGRGDGDAMMNLLIE